MAKVKQQAQIELGDLVKDRITGVEGIVVSDTIWFNGCRRFNVRPTKPNKEGKAGDGETFDEEEVELVKSNQMPCKGRDRAREQRGQAAVSEYTGGPMPSVSIIR